MQSKSIYYKTNSSTLLDILRTNNLYAYELKKNI